MTDATLTADHSAYANGRNRWTKPNTIGMILGFIIFWPVGLAMLAYIVWGDRFGGPFASARDRIDHWNDNFAARREHRRAHRGNCRSRGHNRARSTGNAAFDAYRDEELAKLEEQRQKINEMAREFDAYMNNLRMAKDQKEFDKFMKARKEADKEDDTA